MQPLATYHERFPLYMRRKFELFEDRIVVTISKTFSRQEIPVELARLDSNAGKLWKVKPYFPMLVVLAVLLLLSSLLTIRVFPRPVAWTHWGLSVLVVVFLIRGFQKVEWAQFRNIANIVVLDIARHGPDQQKHEAFVDRVSMQAEMARQKMMQSAVIRIEKPPEDDEFRSN
jgi:hypothetical protein